MGVLEKAKITVAVQTHSGSFKDSVVVEKAIDDLVGVFERPIEIDCMATIDGHLPAYRIADRFEGLIKTRQATAEYLSKVLTEQIMKVLSKHDSIDGYSREEWDKMHKK